MNDLFKFPAVIIDGDNEEKKRMRSGTLGLNQDEEVELVFVEAEYPYDLFVGIEDRWLPSTTSFHRALEGKFDACIVYFANIGQLLVPWSKEKFKRELAKFTELYTKENPVIEEQQELKVLKLTTEQFEKIIKPE